MTCAGMVLGACGSGGAAASAPAAQQPPVEPRVISVSEDAAGGVIEARVGDRIEVNLHSAHHCPGYAWLAYDPWDPSDRPDESVVAYATTEVDESSKDDPRDILIYDAVGAGEAELSLEFVDPDKPADYYDTHEMRTFTATVHVAP